MNQLHNGHKQRLRNRAKNNMDALSEHEILELILNYTVVRSDMNGVAHNLLKKFGSLSAVLNADEQRLLEVEGVGKACASFITLLPAIIKRYNISSLKGNFHGNWSTETYTEYFKEIFASCAREELYMVFLDGRDRFIALENISHGDMDKVDLDYAEVAKKIIFYNAKKLVLAHNHLTCSALPSQTDKISTKALVGYVNKLGVIVCEHIIISREDSYSFRLYDPDCLNAD